MVEPLLDVDDIYHGMKVIAIHLLLHTLDLKFLLKYLFTIVTKDHVKSFKLSPSVKLMEFILSGVRGGVGSMENSGGKKGVLSNGYRLVFSQKW